MSDYPNNWQTIPLSEAIFIQKGKKPFDLGVKSDVRNTPYINIAAFETGVIAEYAPEQNMPYCHPADTLLVWDGARAGLSGRGANGYIGSTLAKITSDIAKPDYLFYFIQSNYHFLNTQTKGVGIPHINPTILGSLEFPLPPLNEQTRIVEKLEELLTDLDTATTELKTAQKKLTQYRQSLLKAAVEGALTAEWRANNTPSESGSQLLERILKERRVRWEQKQLDKFNEQGKTPPKDWQKKYVEPLKPDAKGLMALPEGWVWITADHLISHIETGKSFKCDERTPNNNEIGVVKVSAVSWGEYNELESKTCMDAYRINELLFVREGDFLFSRANTVELVGACVIAKNVNLQVMLSDKILRFRLVEENLKQWLLFILRSTLGRKQIELLASGNQESMRNIGQEQIRQIALPLPPQAEISHIISSLEQSFAAINEQSASIKTSLKQSAAQRKNILKTAFSGQLVPQDPNDEPASVLLERIKAERVAKEVTKKPRQRSNA